MPTRVCNIIVSVAVFSLTLTLGTSALAESTPEAQQWLEKMIHVYEKPFEVNYTGALNMAQMGQPMSGTLSGNIIYGDRTHMRMQMKMEMTGLPTGATPEGTSSMELEVMTVNDGKTTWTEVNMPALGNKQVMKISLEQAAKMAEKQVGMSFGNPSSVDPVSQLEMLAKTMDFKVLSREGGRVVLEGTKTEAAKASEAMAAPGMDSFTLTIDEKTGFPLEVLGGGDQPVIRMEFENLKQLETADLAEGLFDYEPAPGVQVMDLGAMIPPEQNQ